MAVDHGALSKTAVRRLMLERRKKLSQDEVLRLSASITALVVGTPEFKAAEKIALYSSFNNEVSTTELFRKASDEGKKVYYPRGDRERRRLSFVRVLSLTDLVPGIFDIAEPCGKACTEEIEAGSLDLVVAPGVAFDRAGSRIGYGKGFYDRALCNAGAFVIGLAYEFQITGGDLPREEHDVNMDCVVTETEIMRFPRQRRRD